ncbi:snRNA-activating protein complex subunit 4 isoform X2 [Hyaena hyaena]|uniref:snRNA-activating protein complex subunit 4 isoform X2 n=1 Tax=Hyaena hyaena TaxID=95912 RepID=UPI00192443E0|nr:snRNA-activating protein complex subunit 4 isoform X2 [Hyaena hyaena]
MPWTCWPHMRALWGHLRPAVPDSLPEEDSDAASSPVSEEERWGEASNGEDDPKEKTLPEDPETCLQLNMVYQEVIQERLAEVSLLLAQNREQQEEIMCDLAGSKGPKMKDGKSLPPNLYIGHFMKPYFKDRVTGVGPPANEDTREKAAQGIKAFEELLVTKWKSWEKALLRRSVVSDRLQRLLQPKLLKLEYLHQKRSRVTSEAERQVLEKQSRETEREVQDIRELPEEALLGDRLDSHDWEKISNVNFEGGRGAEEIRKFWQNWEHPSINKQEWSGQEVGRLQALAAAHGHLQWQHIAQELGTNRSAFQCLQKYQQHNKGLKRREWTPEEDHLLTQLVQEMRVGSHIPYRRIVYYMEGRDSMQLIYRWTKSLDPSLKKGLWAPEEDAKLLRAVAKYGEQDWFKIREEVPGRSDAQCRDRYLRRLYFGLKKGRWSAKEEEKLVELIEKHGAGHWAKIASELPHRTGSQCLSKWKIMVRKKQSRGRRRRRPPRSERWSSSSEDSSDGDCSGSSSSRLSEDSEPEEAPEAQAAGHVLPSAQQAVPDMALWVPARQGGTWGGQGRRAAPPSPPDSSNGAQAARATCPPASASAREGGQVPTPSGTLSPSASAVGCPGSAGPPPSGSEGPADEKEKLRQPCPLGSPAGAGACVSPLWHRPMGSRQRGRGHSLQRRLLERQLLMAVSPWVGDIVLPSAARRRAVPHTQADGVRKQLQDAHLASTPVFTLFIQLFQIDTAGCMEVVRERKAQPPALLQPGPRDPVPGLLPVPSRTRSTTGPGFRSAPAREPAEQSAGHKGSRALQPCHAESGPRAPPPAPCGPRPKPKTVSELLREKRLREARARKAAQGAVALPPQLLLASPLLLQPRLPGAPHGPSAPGLAVTASVLPGPSAPAATGLRASGARASADNGRPSVLPVLAGAPASTDAAPAASRLSALGPRQVPVNGQRGGLGQSQAPATSRKQGLPEAPPFLPAALSPTQLPVQPVSPAPAVGTREGGPHTAAGTPLPVTWVLTAQGLLPVPTVVGLRGPTGTSDPKGLSVAFPPSLPGRQMGQGPRLPGPSHPWQPPANGDTDSDPRCRTDPPGPPIPCQSQGSVEVDSDGAHGPGGLSFPGEAQVAGDTAVSATPAQATLLAGHPEAKPPGPSQPPLRGGTGPGSGPGGTAGSPSGPEGLREPLGLERPPPPRPGPERGALHLDLLSQESEGVVREWLRGRRGVRVPPLGSRLPYQPPALCSLRALSALLLEKAALEHKAARLVPGGAGALHASLGQVRGRLRDSPAYLLLKARFLAAFTLPALLATLSPDGVPTTLSIAARADSESEDDLGLGESELTFACSTSRPWAGPAATTPVQGAPDPGEGSASSCLHSSDHLDVLRTRRSWHARKRRRLL